MGNGFDNAHNNQFGDGDRGPTGGVNTGGGNAGSGNAGDRGYGYWSYNPGTPEMIMVNGEQRIQITGGWSWVSDDHLHWSDGNEGGSSNDNLRTNVTAKVPSGYRAAVDGYIYMVSVDGNDDIVNVSLYSRPLNSSRQEWMKGESARQEQAKALAQEQINLKKAMEAEAARKVAEAAAAAEAQRQAEEEERRRQAEWDAAHPVEAAQRDVNNASAAATAASNQINADNAQINSNNAEINARQPRLDQLNGEIAQLREVWASMMKAGDTVRANQFHKAQIDPRLNEREPLQSAVESFQAQNNALSQDVANQTATLNSANQQLQEAQSRLQQAQADAEAKRQEELARQAAEEARVQAEREAAERARAEAEARAQAEAEASSKAAALEAARSKLEEPNVFGFAGFPAAAAAVAPLTFAETGLGGYALGEAAAAAAWGTVRAVLADLLGTVLAGSGVGALIASVTYIPGAGEGSDQVPGRDDINMFLSAMPGDAINLPAEHELLAAAAADGTVEMSVRGRVYFSDGLLKTYLVRTINPSRVRVLSATVDAVTGLYSVTIPAESGLPSRTILVSPEGAPGYQGLPPLATPVHNEAVPDNTGNTDPGAASPAVESFPQADDLDFRDAILIFPADSGLDPAYVMLQSGRDLPGKVTGTGADVEGTWLAGASEGLGSPVPTRIADRLRDREFSSFDAFRKAFWQEVAADPELAAQFTAQNVGRMRKGSAPRVSMKEGVGGRRSFELHHTELISLGGEVYNVENIKVMTPKHHINTHSNK
ncbi:MAG: S-type pyocin domain-containing protein [Pantoea sp.]|uniref:S-type pyocin domain-containing protein n=1 Tax=Pantoea sp. TaxID=69393 RepID=UPI00238B34B3|nr:S-type pyocin domain-containing protein [Pantoea sp.]MDE1186590.1 S-type pyocin domain-containing protein [Pantoea sp.]